MDINKINKTSAAPANKTPNVKKYKLLACEIIYREASLLAAQSENIVDVEFLRKGLHDVGQEKMAAALQEAIDGVDETGYDALLLGYGRCNNGIVGLKAGSIPLVIPRAHDCITFFFGSRKAYDEYFAKYPGAYYRTTGWTERDDHQEDSVMSQLGLDKTFEEYVAKYGLDNARYITESMGDWATNYQYLTYINMGLPIDKRYESQARAEAEEKNLQFMTLPGDWRLLKALIAGDWDNDDFLVLQPHQKVVADDGGDIITATTE